MFDLGWSKLVIIAIIAIIVVGPKELPVLLRTIGKFLGQLRRQADEFRTQFNEAMKDTGLDEVRRDIEGIKSTATATVQDLGRNLEEGVKPLQDAAADIQRAGDLSTTAQPAAELNGAGADHSVSDELAGTSAVPDIKIPPLDLPPLDPPNFNGYAAADHVPVATPEAPRSAAAAAAAAAAETGKVGV